MKSDGPRIFFTRGACVEEWRREPGLFPQRLSK